MGYLALSMMIFGTILVPVSLTVAFLPAATNSSA